MENPVTQIRKKVELTRNQLSQAAQVRLDSLYLAEHGLVCRPQKRLLAFLEQLGYPKQELLRDYESYRTQLSEQVMSKIRQVRGKSAGQPKTEKKE